MKSKKTKKALTGSVLALVLCFVMLLGTTFAWFTDTASTSVNTIQAGKLDIALEDANGNTLEGETLSWQKAAGHENEPVLWEPGATYKLQQITIKNKGNLALKYKVVITGIQGDEKLNEAIEWTIAKAGEGGDVADTLAGERYLAAGKSDTLAISGHMKESAGNEYKGLKIDGIAIAVEATQWTEEYDSTTNQYDKDATYGEAVTADELAQILVPNGDGIINITKDYYLTDSWKSINYWGTSVDSITINGNNHTIYNMTVSGGEKAGFIGSNNAKLTINDLTFDGANVTTSGSFAAVVIGYQYGDVTLNNVNVVNSKVATTATYGIRLGGLVGFSVLHDGAKLKLVDCSVENSTFIGYHNTCGLVGTLMEYKSRPDSYSVSGCEVNDCTFVWGSSNETYNNFAFSDGGNYSEKYDVLPSGVTGTGNTASVATTTVSSVEDFNAALNAGKNIVMTDNVTADAKQTTAAGYGKIGVAGVNVNGNTLDGGNKTLTVTNANDTWDCAIMTNGGTIKNLTVKGAFRGIFTGGLSSDLYVENVTIDDTTYTFSADGSGNYNVSFKDCTINGWTSYTSGFKSFSFTNCNFGKSRGYAYCRPYSNTTFTGCTFASDFEFDATQATSTFVNCYVGTTLITADNVTSLLGTDAGNIVFSNTIS